MIPTSDLLRLLDRLVSADHLRAHPTDVRREAFGTFILDRDDVQSFATLARIAAGEVWEGFPAGETVEVPRRLLPRTLLARASSATPIGSPERSAVMRLEQFARSVEQEASS